MIALSIAVYSSVTAGRWLQHHPVFFVTNNRHLCQVFLLFLIIAFSLVN
ncbi:hypothetical protein SAMN05421740_10984 [Parapedobacter koreensis]|uniref:Uncharacterized protein n=1 Tax=Parapedobacter koreensis TaxID=332977 RepID=A0A1H7SNM0_9SPHI|nr:hypothetical protein SAMN05421740_10984 [Parapedobacter koreensis]